MLSNGKHLRFELCRQVQVPSAGKLAVLESRAAKWLFAQAQFSNLEKSMVIVWGISWEIHGSCVGNNFRVIFKYVIVEAHIQLSVFSLDF